MIENMDLSHITQSPHKNPYNQYLQIDAAAPRPDKGLYKWLGSVFPLVITRDYGQGYNPQDEPEEQAIQDFKSRWRSIAGDAAEDKFPLSIRHTLDITGYHVVYTENPEKNEAYRCSIKLDYRLSREIIYKPDGLPPEHLELEPIIYKKKTFAFFPLFTDRDALIVKEQERFPIIQLLPGAGFYFEILKNEEDDKLLRLMIRPEQGIFFKLHFRKQKDAVQAWLQLGFKKVGLTAFLKAAGGELEAEVQDRYRELTGESLPSGPAFTTSERFDFEPAYRCFFQGQGFRLGSDVRRQINNRLRETW
ncbi:MAG: hypothetical protein HQK55_10520, partial [Deltaproteobacteria bacterium]|nr:hypothetical protein [Deltaproteobacteria bacterium]